MANVTDEMLIKAIVGPVRRHGRAMFLLGFIAGMIFGVIVTGWAFS